MLKSTKITLKFDKKAILGLILGFAVLLFFIINDYSTIKAVGLFLLFSFVGFFRLETGSKAIRAALYSAWSTVCVALILFFPWYVIILGYPYKFMKLYTESTAYITNTALIIVAMLAAFVLSGRWRFSVIAVSSVLATLVITNDYVFRFRGKEFIFPDFFATGTALNVASNYDFTPTPHGAFAVSILLLLLFSGFCLPPIKPAHKIKSRIYALVVCIAVSGSLVSFSSGMKTKLWNWDGTLINGYYLNFCLSIRDYFMRAPEDYSPKLIEAIEADYEVIPYQTDKLPNILVIMNESFADFRVFGSELKTNIPVTPFLDSLEENAISGYALSSVFGGSTANSEFEFLTGSSMQFLPHGSTPYQQYLTSSTYSLTWELSKLGYHCLSTHPYYSSGWSRTVVYPLLGFEESTFIDVYPQKDFVRKYISDREMYDYVLDKAIETNEPLFLFGITMQNHSDYTDASFEADVSLQGSSQSYPRAEQYLSLLKLSDEALEHFITQLESFPEDTVVLFFGDHLPSLESEFYNELNAAAADSLDYQMRRHTVPFFIWANYDIEEQYIECTSLNYLAHHLLNAAGLELPPYFQFLEDCEQIIPAVNAFGYWSESRNCFIPSDEAVGEEAEMLKKYEALQYNLIFDKKSQSKLFFDIGAK